MSFFKKNLPSKIFVFGIILGYIFLNEIITSKIVVALIAVFIGIYLARKADYKNVT